MAQLRRGAVLIYNPMAGGQRGQGQATAAAKLLEEAGFAVELQATRGPADATRLAREAVAGGQWEVVFGLGGDGTLREVAKGLLGSSVALGALPAGTANVLARALGLPLNPLEVARRVSTLEPRSFDVGRAGDEPFLMMVSCGLDGRVLERQNSALKKKFGRAAIGLQGLREWWRYDYPAFRLEGSFGELTATFAAVCNIAQFGGNFRLAPNARFDDGHLDLVAFQGRGRGPTLAFAGALAAGRHLRRSDVVEQTVQEVVLSNLDGVGLQVDGDVLEPTGDSLTVGLLPDPLRILAPR